MAKKKTDDAENAPNEGKDVVEKNESVISKKFAKLEDYKAKLTIKNVKYKRQEWIDMSPAFKETLKIPGIPMGAVTQVYGRPDTGKSTIGLEAAAYAIKQGILPVWVITENKFSWERANTMGVREEDCIVFNAPSTIEEGVDNVNSVLKAQEKGDMPFDLLIIWDSIGGTMSRVEKEGNEKGGDEGTGGMMKTARIMNEKFKRFLGPKINDSRNSEYPYTNTMIVINQAYTSPPNLPAKPNVTIEPYGGDALWFVSTLVIRSGGVMSKASKVKATKQGNEVVFAIKTTLIIEKNHVTNVSAGDKIICTDHGFILDDKEALEEYKKTYKNEWNLEYDKYWDKINVEK